MLKDQNCAGGVNGSTSSDQEERGGSNPTSALEFRVGDRLAAKSLILEFHYSRRAKDGGRVIGTFHRPDRNGLCVAACVIHETSAIWRERVLELHRLVRRPYYKVSLSRLISLTCKAVKRLQLTDLVVSYADSTQGHHGGVYQASGWNYHGKRKPIMDGYIAPDGSFIPGRTATQRLGCNRRQELRLRGYMPHFDKGKHLYWRALTPSGEEKAARLGLLKSPYPKPKQRFPKVGGANGQSPRHL